ncbi:MAG: 16S rRNA (cytidine(1402)-2'-O)-methyltransferase [Eubacterium sp.]|nr:16S rRNA (cytidine(1402)-2'-O)-methyltransferase [Eubacterium sp.]
MAGKLILCATPIGNLNDMTPRVIQALKEADLIAAEDTRNSIKLLNHFDIHTPMTSYHEYNKADKGTVLLEKMQEGVVIALITDAGTPGISDPGEDLVRRAIKAGIRVTSLPGPAACITALTMSGMPTRRFVFEAFLPADRKERRQVLADLTDEARTIILYEAPHRLTKTLSELKEILGGERRIALCRELTKTHEEVQQFCLDSALAFYEENEPRGEYVLVIEGKDRKELEKAEQEKWQELSIEEHMELYENQGIDRREAMKMVARDRGISKRDVYNSIMKKQI